MRQPSYRSFTNTEYQMCYVLGLRLNRKEMAKAEMSSVLVQNRPKNQPHMDLFSISCFPFRSPPKGGVKRTEFSADGCLPLIFQRGAAEHRLAAEGGVEGVERHRKP